MNKSQFFQELRNLLSGTPEKLYYSDEYCFYVVKAGIKQSITELQAKELILQGCKVVVFQLNRKIWNWDKLAFIGQELQPLPEILKGTRYDGTQITLQKIEVNENCENSLLKLWE